MTTSKAILVAAAIISLSLLVGLLLGNRYQIARDRDFNVWRLDKLTGTVSTCTSAGSSCRDIKG
jgi:hypothetical protein